MHDSPTDDHKHDKAVTSSISEELWNEDTYSAGQAGSVHPKKPQSSCKKIRPPSFNPFWPISEK
ncbi:hypothetical protein [Paenibacillus apii]|uniref:hypothetical protein n=1 Tax=Paenibacillus apii TaxID=1850370 RepID=UPI002E2815DC|nr:hypothetical protein [Paenibacillus apii]